MSSSKDTSTQESNSELRIRYLQFLQFLNEKPVDIRLYEKVDVSGKFLAFQRSGDHFIVNKLQTPMALVENGVIRVSDTIFIGVSTGQS